MGNGSAGAGRRVPRKQRRRTICVDGDGGLQLNIQELETVRRLALPIKLFVLNNDGYASSVRLSPDTSGGSPEQTRRVAVTLPPPQKVVEAYGLPYTRIDSDRDLAARVREILDVARPARDRGDDTARGASAPSCRRCGSRIGSMVFQSRSRDLLAVFSRAKEIHCRTSEVQSQPIEEMTCALWIAGSGQSA
jgi:hypothetical protein